MSAPTVSVVIPNYNYAHYVGQAVESALAQTYRDREIIVVDNGSSDNSLEVLRGYGDQIRVIAQENRGQAGSRNRGIVEARGAFVAFLDADDVWLPAKLEKQMPLFASPEVCLVYCGYFVADASLQPTNTFIPTLRGKVLERFVRGAGAVISGGESTAVIRKECFATVGMFDPALSISCGWDMYRRLCTRYEIDVVPEALVYYRQHGMNAHQRVDIFEHDVLLRLQKLFSDPMARSVHGTRGETYGKSYRMLSGSYLQAGNWGKAIEYAVKSMLVWPAGARQTLALGASHLKRFGNGRKTPPAR